jgi:hypothetical protein
MNKFPPDLDPQIYNISAILIGLSLVGNFSAAEQNAIGNWFITIGQVLENNSAWQGVIENRIQGGININSKNAKCGGDPTFEGMPFFESNTQKEIDNLKKSLDIIIEELKKMQ